MVAVGWFIVAYVYMGAGMREGPKSEEMALGDYFEHRAEVDYPDWVLYAFENDMLYVELVRAPSVF